MASNNNICTDIVRADNRSTSSTLNITNIAGFSSHVDRAHCLNGAQAIVRVLSIPAISLQPNTPFLGCFTGLAFAVLFREWLLSSPSAGGNGDGDGNEIDGRCRDLQEQMRLCAFSLKDQAKAFPVLASGADMVVDLLKMHT